MRLAGVAPEMNLGRQSCADGEAWTSGLHSGSETQCREQAKSKAGVHLVKQKDNNFQGNANTKSLVNDF